MKKNRVLAFLLACLTVSSVLISCGSGNSEKPAQAEAQGETTAAETEEELTESERRARVKDDLPDTDYKGKKYIVLTTDSNVKHYVVEEQTGSAINDALYNRNATVQERFNCKIETISGKSYTNVPPMISSAVLSGDSSAFTIVSYHMVSNGTNASSGYYVNWYDVPHINFEKPWWSDSNVDCLTVNGKCFIAQGDMALGSIINVWFYLMNKSLAADLNIPNVYDLVRSHKWTFDKFLEVIADAYSDLDGDGERTENDRYGITSGVGSALLGYQYAFNNPIISKDSKGQLEYTMYSEKYIDIVQKVVNLYFYNKSAFYQPTDTKGLYQTIFQNGRTLFSTGFFDWMVNKYVDVDFNIGVVPLPLYNEKQEEYHSFVNGGADTMGITVINDDLDFTGCITEAMCAETYKQYYPVYYDVVMKNRYADEPDDAEMMDIVINGRIYDIGYYYDFWKGAAFWMDKFTKEGNTDVASYYAANWETAKKYYDENVIALFK